MRKINRKSLRLTVLITLILIFAVLFTCICTYSIVQIAHFLDAQDALAQSRAYQISISNLINTVKFEIRRELLPENLSYKAQTQLGMVMPPESVNLRLLASADDMK